MDFLAHRREDEVPATPSTQCAAIARLSREKVLVDRAAIRRRAALAAGSTARNPRPRGLAQSFLVDSVHARPSQGLLDSGPFRVQPRKWSRRCTRTRRFAAGVEGSEIDGELSISRFADGEMEAEIGTSVRGCDVFLFAGGGAQRASASAWKRTRSRPTTRWTPCAGRRRGASRSSSRTAARAGPTGSPAGTPSASGCISRSSSASASTTTSPSSCTRTSRRPSSTPPSARWTTSPPTRC